MFVIRFWHQTKQTRSFDYICEEKVKAVLNWDNVYPAIEDAMKAASQSKVEQPRTRMHLPDSPNEFLSMPVYSRDSKYGPLACKVVSSFPHNENVPAVHANVMLFSPKTGELKAIVAGNHVTAMSTAAASVVATKTIYKPANEEPLTMAIIGAGTRGMAHAEAFHHFFNLNEVRFMDSDYRKAKDLAAKLNKKHKFKNVFKALEFGQDCVKDADIIVCATNAYHAVVREFWLKNHCHIIILSRRDGDSSEIDDETFRSSEVYTDSLESYKKETPILFDRNYNVKGEIGSVIGQDLGDRNDIRTVFASFGMGVEDAVTAGLAFELYRQNGKC